MRLTKEERNTRTIKRQFNEIRILRTIYNPDYINETDNTYQRLMRLIYKRIKKVYDELYKKHT